MYIYMVCKSTYFRESINSLGVRSSASEYFNATGDKDIPIAAWIKQHYIMKNFNASSFVPRTQVLNIMQFMK